MHNVKNDKIQRQIDHMHNDVKIARNREKINSKWPCQMSKVRTAEEAQRELLGNENSKSFQKHCTMAWRV